MRTGNERTIRRVLVLAAAWLLLLAPLAGRIAAQPAPTAPAADDQNDDPPRRDIHMGNTENMRMGRNAQGDVIMEVHAPPKKATDQPPVGPFYIYPQIGIPSGGQGGQSMPGGSSGQGRSSMGQTGQRPGSGMSGQGMGVQPGQGQMGQTGQMPVRPGQMGQTGQTTSRSGQATPSGQTGQSVSPGQTSSPSGQSGQSPAAEDGTAP